ncbi:MAG: CDP-glycerol glycerophosphotransferase family protein [Hominisplanchenecus sp.]
MKSFLKYLFSLCMRAVLLPFHLFPVKQDRLVFSGLTGGKGYEYSCNPRYLSDFIQEYAPGEFEIFWMVSDPKRYAEHAREKLHFVKHFGIRCFYCLLTAKVIVTNGSYAPWFPFRKQQYLINTWHGGGAYKKIENDKPDANWATRKRAEFCANNISLFVSSCQMADEKLFRHAFLYRGEILACGTPRNDSLVLGQTRTQTEKVRRKCRIEKDARILLYAPTYRPGSENALPDFDRLRKILEKNGEKWYVLYRAHRYSEDEAAAWTRPNFRDVTKYEDMQELLCAADMLITDYSSCIWDYSFLYRPCFLYTPDLEEYLAKTGFYVDIHQWPFPICQDMPALEQAILTYDQDANRKAIDKHHMQMGNYESGHACEAVCERIVQICNVSSGT